MCPQVLVLDECNIAQLHFEINKEIRLKQSSRSNSFHSFLKVLLFRYMCVLRLCFWGNLTTGLRNLLQPCSRAARKWRENEEMERE